MKLWQYKNAIFRVEHLIADMNELGNEGWELVHLFAQHPDKPLRMGLVKR